MTEIPSRPQSQAATTAGTTAAGAAISELLQPFQDEAKATRRAIEDRISAQRRISQWLIAFVAVTAVLVILVLWMLVRDNQRRAQSREILRNNAAVSERIADCTNTTGKCYQENQKRLAATIQRLTEANKIVALCAHTSDSEAEMNRCVEERLKKLTPAP